MTIVGTRADIERVIREESPLISPDSLRVGAEIVIDDRQTGAYTVATIEQVDEDCIVQLETSDGAHETWAATELGITPYPDGTIRNTRTYPLPPELQWQ